MTFNPNKTAPIVSPVVRVETEMLAAALPGPPPAPVPGRFSLPWVFALALVSMVKKVAPMAGPRPNWLLHRES